MKKKVLWFSAKVFLVLFLAGSSLYLYATELTPQDKKEFLEIEEEVTEGDFVTKKIPAIEDPCKYTQDAREKAKEYLKQNLNLKYEKSEAEAILKEINAKKFNDLHHLAGIIYLCLPSWACKNNYKIHKTAKMGDYYFKKEKSQGIFIGVMEDGFLPSEGVRQGRADLHLYPGLMGNDMYFQIIITKLPNDPNGKTENVLDKEAQKLINNILDYAYTYAKIYYTFLISEIDKK